MGGLAQVLMLRCLFSAPKGHRKIARGFQPLDPECERGPGAGSPWLFTIAPVGARKPRNIETGGGDRLRDKTGGISLAVSHMIFIRPRLRLPPPCRCARSAAGAADYE